MGYVRYLLAAIVVAYHCQMYRYITTIGGIAAVEAFFFISGFYMAAAYRNYEKNVSGAVSFWLSRFVRLYPLYIFVVILTCLFWLSGYSENAISTFNAFKDGPPGVPYFSNVSMLGLDVISIDEPTHLKLLVRQAWSVSAELVFYALVPVILQIRQRVLTLVILAFALKFLLTEMVGWRDAYFPFFSQIGYFFFGMWLFEFRRRLTWGRSYAIGSAALLTCYVIVSPFASFELDGIVQNCMMITAISIVMPSAFVHLNGKISSILGDLSYGVYIAHFLVIEVLTSAGAIDLKRGTLVAVIWQTFATIVTASALAAAFEFTLQRPIDRWRRRTFYRRSREGDTLATTRNASA
jgi:peptidoglycan/LPS O-acetylase OafA/YrhL